MKDDKDSVEAFYTGIICALLVVVDGHDQDTIAREILQGCDRSAIRRIAKREGDKSIVKLVDDYRRDERDRAKLRLAQEGSGE